MYICRDTEAYIHTYTHTCTHTYIKCPTSPLTKYSPLLEVEHVRNRSQLVLPSACHQSRAYFACLHIQMIYIHACPYVLCMYTYHTQIYTCILHIHTYVYTCTHTHTHVYTYIFHPGSSGGDTQLAIPYGFTTTRKANGHAQTALNGSDVPQPCLEFRSMLAFCKLHNQSHIQMCTPCLY
jgi:hypothetical protein